VGLRYTRPVMPTYEYLCKDCGHTFEVVQSMNDEPLTVCPECGGDLRKIFAPPAIAFKGSGFYATDHGKKSKKAGDKAPAEKSGDTPAEKPAASSEKKDTPKEPTKQSTSRSNGGKAS
jgi:putative FmdB family regulatory protein